MKRISATQLMLFLTACFFSSAVLSQPASPTSNQQALVTEILAAYEDHLGDLEVISQHADYALLAWAAYEDRAALEMASQRGWSPLQNFGLPSSPITGAATATLFVSEDGNHVLAFRGTATARDWVTNLAGTVATYEDSIEYSQIRDAVDISREIASQFDELVIVGHSLGARLAQISALETGRRAVAFDRAPFGAVELQRWPGLALVEPSSIERFRGWADPLTAVNPFARDDIEVHNIVRGDSADNYIYGHSMNLLALAMQDVRIAWESGWLSSTPNSRLSFQEQLEAIRSSYPRAPALEGCPVPYGPLSISDYSDLLYGTSLTYRRSSSRSTEYRFYIPKIPQGTNVFLCEGSEADFALQGHSVVRRTVRPSLLYNVRKQPIPSLVSETRRGNLFEGEMKRLQTGTAGCEVLVPADSDGNRAEWSGACDNGLPVGTGRLSLFNDEELVDYIDVDPAHHLSFEDGELIWTINLNDYAFTMSNCSLHSNGKPDTKITSTTDRPSSAMADFTVAGKLLEAGIEFGSAVCGHSPPVLKGSGAYVYFPGHQYPVVRTWADANGNVSDSDIKRYASNDKRNEIRRLNQERVQRERDEMRERFRQASIEVKREREVQAIRTWENALRSGEPLTNIADLLKYQPARTMARLSEGREIIVEIRNVRFSAGELIAQARHYYTDIYEGVDEEAKTRLGLASGEEERFSWAQWFDMINRSTRDRYVEIECRLNAQEAEDLAVGSRYMVHGQLISYGDPEFGAPIARFQCELEGAVQ